MALLLVLARGIVTYHDGFIAGLKAGEIAGAGIDVLPEEPPPADDPIVRCYADFDRSGLNGRLIVTPHAA